MALGEPKYNPWVRNASLILYHQTDSSCVMWVTSWLSMVLPSIGSMPPCTQVAGIRHPELCGEPVWAGSCQGLPCTAEDVALLHFWLWGKECPVDTRLWEDRLALTRVWDRGRKSPISCSFTMSLGHGFVVLSESEIHFLLKNTFVCVYLYMYIYTYIYVCAYVCKFC